MNNKDNKATISDNAPILFNCDMRKTFVKGVLQDIKGYFENITNGNVQISYEDNESKSYEFGFKLIANKGEKCKKQMWSEVTGAIVNVINYMFPYDCTKNDNSIDVMVCAQSNMLEIEIVSKW